MTHASLFSGIGGFDLAAEWIGWDNIFHCEWNPFGQRVLAHHFPNSKSYNDITKTDFSIHAGQIDVLTGGFPCQPYSSAGKRLGKADERHLFPHMLRCVKEVKPKYVIGENVRGLVNWNGGLVFHEVQDDLEREGYEVQSFLIPAASVNAPHQRYRIWFVAYCKDFGCQPTKTSNKWEEHIQNDRNGIRTSSESNGEIRNVTDSSSIGLCEHSEGERLQSKTFGTQIRMDNENVANPNSIGGWENDREHNRKSNVINKNGETGDVSDSKCIRLQHGTNSREISREETNAKRKGSKSTLSSETNGYGYKSDWSNFPTKSPICGGDDGIPRELDSITFSKWRKESIKGYGNAIVPQVAFEIFKTIQQFEDVVNV
jgi:DNA (cytosine-5)-methyltransferase 1